MKARIIRPNRTINCIIDDKENAIRVNIRNYFLLIELLVNL